MTFESRSALPGSRCLGPSIRFVLSALAGILSLLAVVGMPADRLVPPGAAVAAAFDALQGRTVPDVPPSLRIEGAALDADAPTAGATLAPEGPGVRAARNRAGHVPQADQGPRGVILRLPERPPRD